MWVLHDDVSWYHGLLLYGVAYVKRLSQFYFITLQEQVDVSAF